MPETWEVLIVDFDFDNRLARAEAIARWQGQLNKAATAGWELVAVEGAATLGSGGRPIATFKRRRQLSST